MSCRISAVLQAGPGASTEMSQGGGNMGSMPLSWLPERSVASLQEALRSSAPSLSTGDIELQPWLEHSITKWWHGSAIVNGQVFVKFAWSKEAAEQVWHEACVLMSLGKRAVPLRAPRVIAASDNPVLLATEWIAGDPLTYEQVGNLSAERLRRTAAELARFLSDLHRPDVLAEVQRDLGPLPTPLPQATTTAIRDDLAPFIRSDQVCEVSRWCDWVDGILDVPTEPVFVQGDFHGHNQVWDLKTQTLKAVLDYGDSGAADPAYDFRYLPSQGPTINLFRATASSYAEYAGTPIDASRVMAWHIRTVLGDALWRSQAGVPLPGDRSPSEWVDELRGRLEQLQIADF